MRENFIHMLNAQTRKHTKQSSKNATPENTLNHLKIITPESNLAMKLAAQQNYSLKKCGLGERVIRNN